MDTEKPVIAPLLSILMNSNQHRLSIVIPVYNNAGTIRPTLNALFEEIKDTNFEVIIVNDGSTDQSLEILEVLRDMYEFHLLNFKITRGYGGAIKEGIRYSFTEYILTVEPDWQNDMHEVKQFYNKLIEENADMIVGKRTSHLSEHYLSLEKKLIRLATKLAIPHKIIDTNSGFLIFRRDLAAKYLRFCADSRAFNDMILLNFLFHKHYTLEIPVSCRNEYIAISTSAHTLSGVIRVILNIMLFFSPLKLFIPVAVMLFLSGVIILADFLTVGLSRIGHAVSLLITGAIFLLIGFLAQQISDLRRDL